jgi:hypothetical protein
MPGRPDSFNPQPAVVVDANNAKALGYIPYSSTGERGQPLTGYRLPTEREVVIAEAVAKLPEEVQALVRLGYVTPYVTSTGNNRNENDQVFKVSGYNYDLGDGKWNAYDTDLNFLGQEEDHGAAGFVGNFLQKNGQNLLNLGLAAGIGAVTGGLGNQIGASLVSSGLVTSTVAANAIGAAAVNAGIAMARGQKPTDALQNAAVGLLTSQYISPAVAQEVKSVIDSPLGQQLATNAGTSLITGTLTGQSQAQIEKNILGSSTGILANAASADVRKEMLNNIEDPDIARIASETLGAGTKSLIMGKDVGRDMLNAGATALAHTDIPLGDTFSDLKSGLSSVDLSGLKDAVKPFSDALTSVAQPISDAATQVFQPVEGAIKDVAKAGSDVVTQFTQPLEQPIKDIAQAGSDAVTQVTQPIEGALKDAYQTGSDLVQKGSDAVTEVLQPVEGAIKDAYNNLPSVDLPKVDLPKVDLPNVNLPKVNVPKVTSPLPVQTATPTTGALPSSASSPWLDSTAQMLKAAPVESTSPTKMTQLKQLYQSLTPEMQSAFAMHGIQDPEMAAHGGSIGGYAKGGTTSDFQTLLDSLTPDFAKAPRMLDAAPVTNEQARLAALKQLRSGLTSRSQASGMAHGGLPTKYAEAAPNGHKPEFITGVTGYYAQGGGTGQSDDIPAMLHEGDYVIDADAVAAFGDGSSKAGAEVLSKFQSQIPFKDDGAAHGRPIAAKIADGEYVFPSAFVTAIGGGDNKRGAKILDTMRAELREHKRAAPTSKIPPKAKSPLDYLKSVKG